jgi:hypothetical protein
MMHCCQKVTAKAVVVNASEKKKVAEATTLSFKSVFSFVA